MNSLNFFLWYLQRGVLLTKIMQPKEIEVAAKKCFFCDCNETTSICIANHAKFI
jgi:hypothetical protein